MSTGQPDAGAPAVLTSQIQAVLQALMTGPEARNIKPGHYIVVIDTNLTEWSTVEVLYTLRTELALADIHIHLVPTVPGGLTFVEVAPALAQFPAEQEKEH